MEWGLKTLAQEQKGETDGEDIKTRADIKASTGRVRILLKY